MRVTHKTLIRDALQDLQSAATSMAKYQMQLSSGKSIQKPSDDPFGTERSLNLRSSIAAIEQAQRNIASSEDWLNATDSSMGHFSDILTEARSIAVRGASDSAGADANATFAKVVSELIASAIQAGNSSSGGWYLFAGSQVDEVAFEGLDAGGNVTSDPEAMGSVRYTGDDGTIQREVEPGVEMTINTTGSEAWLDPGDSGSVFATLIRLRDALATNDSDAVLATIGDLDNLISQCSLQQGVVGAKLQRLTLANDKLSAMSVSLQSLLSQTEDADMAEATVYFSQQQVCYQAALKVNSQILTVSLFDYLR